MFNNVGRCAHIWPIIGCKGNVCMAGSQTNGRAVATMYGFALYTLSERFMLRRFAIVLRMSVRRFKGLNSSDWAWISRLSEWLIGEAHFRRIFETEERQRLPDRRQMLPRKWKVIGLCRVSLSFASRALGTAVTGQWTTPLPTTCCHKLPPHCKTIVLYRQRLYFAGRKKNKQ